MRAVADVNSDATAVCSRAPAGADEDGEDGRVDERGSAEIDNNKFVLIGEAAKHDPERAVHRRKVMFTVQRQDDYARTDLSHDIACWKAGIGKTWFQRAPQTSSIQGSF